jgi:hypothetical protein
VRFAGPLREGAAEIRRMSVAAAARRDGVGRVILAELIATARTWRVPRVVLETTSTWTAAIDFYRSCGFTVTGEVAGEHGRETWFELPLLSPEQIAEFAGRGLLVVPGVVPEERLAAADDEVAALAAAEPPPAAGPRFWFRPPDQLPAADAALRRSPALGLAQQLTGPLQLGHALDHIQVALNVPPFPHRPGGPHLDGHRPDQARPHTFTMLVAVFLDDESRPDSGNLWVWPGSHLAHGRLFRERGTGVLLPVSGHSTLLHPPVQLAAPEPVLARRGDLLLAHYLLGHNSGGNTAPRTRRILYYRLAAAGHRGRWEATFRDPWCEYAPVRRAAADG